MTILEFLFGNGEILLIAPVLAAAGISALASAGQSYATGKMNKASRNFQREMFDKTNAYNSPLEQRKRLEAAGLNPNMVYGGSSGGTAGTASQPSKPDFNTPEIGAVGEALSTGALNYYQTKQIQSTIDVNEARTNEIKQNTVNKGIDAVNKALQANHGSLDFKTKSRLYDNTIRTAEQSLDNLAISGKYTSDKNTREERVTNQTVSKIRAETENARKQGKILSEEAIMKRLDRILYEDYKLRPDDPFYAKIFARMMQEIQEFNPIPKALRHKY